MLRGMPKNEDGIGELGSAQSERAQLEAMLEVDRDRVALVARFGSEEAARVLGVPVADPPRVLGLCNLAELNQAFGSWEVGLVYTRAVLRHVLEWWASRGADYRDTVNDLGLTLTAVDEWFDGERTREAAEAALAWARAGGARGSLVRGRFESEGRALGHLAHALGGLAYVCAPLEEPLRRGDPIALVVARFGIRMKRIADSRGEVAEAVDGVMYMQHPEIDRTQPEFEATRDAVARPFEALAAGELRRWVLETG
jgi:hypothetical protein